MSLILAGFNKKELNIESNAIKNTKEQSLVNKKQDKVCWLDKTLTYPDINTLTILY